VSDEPGRLAGVDWNDPLHRERLAREAYYRTRLGEVALDREHELEPAQYWVLEWACLSAEAQAPFRAAVAVCCDAFVAA
jgi:hypothetical protein